MVASRGGYQMARGRHYAKLSLSNAARLSFSDLCILLFMFLSLCRLCVCVFLCSHWSLVDVPLIFFCPADHVPDWQPRVLLGMVEARSVNVKKTTTTTGLRPLGAISPHVPNLRGHSHVSLFSRNVWASKVTYRGSAVNALVVLGIPPQMPQKRSRHTQTTFFGLVARRRLSSSEGAPEGVGEVC